MNFCQVLNQLFFNFSLSRYDEFVETFGKTWTKFFPLSIDIFIFSRIFHTLSELLSIILLIQIKILNRRKVYPPKWKQKKSTELRHPLH